MTDQAAPPPRSGGGLTVGAVLNRLKRGDIALAFGLIGILMILFMPLPVWLLDVMLALSITSSVLILMTVLFIEKPLQLNSFPTILLIVTLFRLSLNVATTRLILSHGHTGPDAAGHVIQAFGNFLMGSNPVIGIIIFAILVIINFIVITKGSGRIAEVSARFSLDAMPGKQMAIDADLSAGLIDEAEAKRRRRELEEESSFYGAMDGSAKFVRGDAIAAILVTAINIIGGIIIGTVMHGVSFGEAGMTYTLLTVGDGLVSQIPALIISVAAGLLVTKAGVSGTADKAVFGQLSAYPNALGMSAGLLGAMALLPGIPMIPFVGVAALLGWAAYKLPKSREAELKEQAQAASDAEKVQTKPEEPIQTALAIDLIRVELGYGLLVLMNGDSDKRLTDQIKGLRRQLAGELGFVLPSVRIQDNLQLPANTYVIRVKEIEAGRGELRPNMLLAMDPRGEPIRLPGEATREPTFGLPAHWLDPGYREEALFRGLTVVDPGTVLTTHLTEVVKDNLSELMSYGETQKLLDEIDGPQKKLVSDLIPGQISVGGVQRVLQNLLTERVSIRDLPRILEGVAEATAFTRNTMMITEHVRSRLARQLSDSHTGPAGHIPIIVLSPEWEQAFADSLHGEGDEKSLAMPPSQLQTFITAVRGAFEKAAMTGESPVLLTSPRIRPYVRSLAERFRPQTSVMSQSEIHPRARIKTVGQV